MREHCNIECEQRYSRQRNQCVSRHACWIQLLQYHFWKYGCGPTAIAWPLERGHHLKHFRASSHLCAEIVHTFPCSLGIHFLYYFVMKTPCPSPRFDGILRESTGIRARLAFIVSPGETTCSHVILRVGCKIYRIGQRVPRVAAQMGSPLRCRSLECLAPCPRCNGRAR